MKGFISPWLLLLFCSSVAVAHSSLTRDELVGVRHAGPGKVVDSNATFAIGMSTDGGVTFSEEALVSDEVSVTGIVRPERDDVGHAVDIFVVDRYNLTSFTMRNSAGDFVRWNGNIQELTPYLKNKVLTAAVDVEIFAGKLEAAGNHRFFLGYMPADGILRFTPIAYPVDISEQSIRALAVAKFAESISDNIVQGNCVVCHRIGGRAQGLSAVSFVTTANAENFALNFNSFEKLVHDRGHEFILSKVTEGSAHGVLLPGSVDYENLEEFLELMERL